MGEHDDTRILTTHCGSLPRPRGLLELMQARAEGRPYREEELGRAVRDAVHDSVGKQLEAGIDIVTDGEQGKLGFQVYTRDRLSGFEIGPRTKIKTSTREDDAFPEYFEEYYARLYADRVVPTGPTYQSELRCVGPIEYVGQAAIQADVDNLRSALDGASPAGVFLPSLGPRPLGVNAFYPTEEEYEQAWADAMRVEYRAILDAGFSLQIDEPSVARTLAGDRSLPEAENRARAERCIEHLNYALRGLPPERLRLHVCYGANEGPKFFDPDIGDFVEPLMRIDVGAYSFEASNPRHAHEWKAWRKVRLPEGKVLIPGFISHGSNFVEHPEWIAERIVTYAGVVGRENVIAGADCGFSSQATFRTEVHPTVVWAKLRSLAEGAQLASRELWG